MKTYKLYNDKIELQFDEVKHEYFKEGKLIPNMTNITKLASDTSGALLGWGMKLASEKFLQIVQPNQIYDEVELINMAKQIKDSAIKSRDRSGDIGTILHNHVENFLQFETIPKIHNPEIANAYKCFEQWYQTVEFEVISTEKKVYYEDSEYCFTGTCDCLAKDKDGYIVMDWKTSKSANYFNYKLQVVGYAIALEKEHNIKINRAKILCFPKVGKFKEVLVDIDQTMREGFFACLKLYQTINNKKEKKQ